MNTGKASRMVKGCAVITIGAALVALLIMLLISIMQAK
jgi:hypothetical protein